MLTFDEQAHRYTLNGRPVPSVTTVLRAVIPHFDADDWYLQRGTAVHACAALIAQGKDFDADPQINGQVAACRKFFADYRPTVLHVEQRVASTAYGFAGTLDLVCAVDGEVFLVDWKSTLTKTVQWQLGAYAVGLKESCGLSVKKGFGIELKADGTYKAGETYDLTRAGREFLAFLGSYNAMKREGII
jgi:hypothetical protein